VSKSEPNQSEKGQVVSSYGLEHFVSMIRSPSTASVDDTPH